MKIYRDEIIRYANCTEGTKVWERYKLDGDSWMLTDLPLWSKDYIYVVNDMYAELRKKSIDTGRPIQTFSLVPGWVNIKDASELTGPLSNYRVKPIEKEKATESGKKKKKDLLASSKVRELLYCSEHGWGSVTDIVDGDYPLCVKFRVERATFTLDGKRHKDDKYPTLFWDKDEATRKRSKKRLPNLKVGTLVIVWEEDFDEREIRQFKRFTKKGKMRCLPESGGKEIKWPNWELAG